MKSDYSRGLMTTLSRLGLEAPEKAYADLVAAGWSENDAYIVVGLYQPLLDILTNGKQFDALNKDQKFMRYLNKVKDKSSAPATKTRSTPTIESDDDDFSDGHSFDISKLSKEEQLKELYYARRNFKAGTKEWIDLSKMISDITQAKKDEVKTEDTTIHYYLPLTCCKCALYVKRQKERGD